MDMFKPWASSAQWPTDSRYNWRARRGGTAPFSHAGPNGGGEISREELQADAPSP